MGNGIRTHIIKKELSICQSLMCLASILEDKVTENRLLETHPEGKARGDRWIPRAAALAAGLACTKTT